MVDTVERTLYPLSLVAFIFGFGILRYPLGRTRFRLSIFYILTVWSAYVCVFRHLVIFFSPKSIFSGSLNFFMVVVNLLITMISIIITARKHEKFDICIRKLSLVDDTLEELGTSKKYCRMPNSIKYALIMWFIMICTTWFVDSLWFIKKLNDTRAIIVPFIKDYSVHVNTFMDIIFMFLLRCIGARLDEINECIRQLSETEEYGLRCTWKKSLLVSRRYVRSTENRKHALWITMHLHSELCRIAHDINSLFGMQMTLQMISHFFILIGLFYFQYHTMLCLKQMYGGDTDRLKVLLCSDIWFTVCITKLISFNHVCESVSAKAQKTKGIIHRLTNLILFDEIREEICQFVLQISLRPLKFTGMGLFYFGYKFIHKFFIWILTAVIFMVQMDTSPMSRIITDRNNITCYNL